MKKRYKKYVLQVLDDANKLQTDILDKEDFVKLFIDIETDYVEWSKKMAARQNTLSVRRLHIIVSHWAFEIVGTALAFVNTALLFIMLCQTSKEAINVGATIVLDLNIFITVYFVIEQVLRLLGHGPRFYFTSLSFVFDLAITLTLAVLTIILYSNPPFVDEGMSEDITRGINLLICLRFTRVFLQVKRLRVVVKTYLTLIRQMQVYLGILAALMYVYAIIGMELFSIELTNDIHNRSAVDKHHKLLSRQCGTYWNLDYYSLNFDDFFASIVTLFTLMVVNNWHVLVDAFSQSRGEWWAGFYFISWWVVCVLIILNVIIALILDAFIARWDNKDQDTVSGGHFHVHQFVEQSERARAMSEGEVTNELAKINIIKKPFMMIGNNTPDMPSAREATSRKIYCAN